MSKAILDAEAFSFGVKDLEILAEFAAVGLEWAESVEGGLTQDDFDRVEVLIQEIRAIRDADGCAWILKGTQRAIDEAKERGRA